MTHSRRNRSRDLAVGMLAAGLLLLAICGMSPKPTTKSIAELRSKVQKTVADPARAAQALAALDSVSALLPYVAELQTRASNDLRAALRNYRSTRADFEVVITRWEADRARVRTSAFAAHDRFKRALTDEEWKKLKSDERAILFQYPIVTVPGTDTPPQGAR